MSRVHPALELTNNQVKKVKTPLPQQASIESTAPQYGKTEVEIRITFIKIGSVNTVGEKYDGDVFIESMWREPLLDGTHNVSSAEIKKLWNPRLSIANVAGNAKEILSYEVRYKGQRNDLAFVCEKRRVKGTFNEILELKHFPFDCQDLSITVISELSSNEVSFVESAEKMSQVNSTRMDSQEWDLHCHVEISQEDIRNDADLGPRTRPTITFTTRASRRYIYFALNNILISVVLTFLVFYSFAVPRIQTQQRLLIAFTLLLTTVTFKSAASQNLPKVPYLTYLDHLILGNIVVIVTVCIWHASISLVPVKNSDFTNQEFYAIIGLTGLYLLYLLSFFLRIYFDAGARRREMFANDEKYLEELAKSNSRSLTGISNIP